MDGEASSVPSHDQKNMFKNDRNDVLINGALIALGALAIVDNVVAHWLLGLHRAIPGPWAGVVEVGLIVLGAGMLILGAYGEKYRHGGADASPLPMA